MPRSPAKAPGSPHAVATIAATAPAKFFTWRRLGLRTWRARKSPAFPRRIAPASAPRRPKPLLRSVVFRRSPARPTPDPRDFRSSHVETGRDFRRGAKVDLGHLAQRHGSV